MSDEKKRKSHSLENFFVGDGALYEYTKRPAVFVVIAMAVAIIVAFVAIKPLGTLVHKAENHYNISSGDIVIEQDKLYSLDEAELGQSVAKLTIANSGVNTTVFYGKNRVSSRQGAGLSVVNSLFGDEGTTYISGYDEGALGSLKATQKGDKITIKTADKLMTYEVEDAYFDKTEWEKVKPEGKLVVYSVFSDFSEHKGERFFVIADKVSEEVITNE